MLCGGTGLGAAERGRPAALFESDPDRAGPADATAGTGTQMRKVPCLPTALPLYSLSRQGETSPDLVEVCMRTQLDGASFESPAIWPTGPESSFGIPSRYQALLSPSRLNAPLPVPVPASVNARRLAQWVPASESPPFMLDLHRHPPMQNNLSTYVSGAKPRIPQQHQSHLRIE